MYLRLIYQSDWDEKIKVYFVNGECTFYLEINCLLFHINSMFHISSKKKIVEILYHQSN